MPNDTFDISEADNQILDTQADATSYLQGYESDEALLNAIKSGDAAFTRSADGDAFEDSQGPAEESTAGQFDAYNDEYHETGGLSEESFAELEEQGYSREMVEQYIRGYEEAEGIPQELDGDQMTFEENAELLDDLFDGDEGTLDDMINWARENFDDISRDKLASALESSDVAYRREALAAARDMYEESEGSPDMHRGSAHTELNQFSSWTKQAEALADPRYKNNPEYTRWVQSKMIPVS